MFIRTTHHHAPNNNPKTPTPRCRLPGVDPQPLCERVIDTWANNDSKSNLLLSPCKIWCCLPRAFYVPIAISFSIIGMCRLVCSAYLANTSHGACSFRKVVLPLNDSLAGSSSSSRPTKHKQRQTHRFQL